MAEQTTFQAGQQIPESNYSSTLRDITAVNEVQIPPELEGLIGPTGLHIQIVGIGAPGVDWLNKQLNTLAHLPPEKLKTLANNHARLIIGTTWEDFATHPPYDSDIGTLKLEYQPGYTIEPGPTALSIPRISCLVQFRHIDNKETAPNKGTHEYLHQLEGLEFNYVLGDIPSRIRYLGMGFGDAHRADVTPPTLDPADFHGAYGPATGEYKEFLKYVSSPREAFCEIGSLQAALKAGTLTPNDRPWGGTGATTIRDFLNANLNAYYNWTRIYANESTDYSTDPPLPVPQALVPFMNFSAASADVAGQLAIAALQTGASGFMVGTENFKYTYVIGDLSAVEANVDEIINTVSTAAMSLNNPIGLQIDNGVRLVVQQPADAIRLTQALIDGNISNLPQITIDQYNASTFQLDSTIIYNSATNSLEVKNMTFADFRSQLGTIDSNSILLTSTVVENVIPEAPVAYINANMQSQLFDLELAKWAGDQFFASTKQLIALDIQDWQSGVTKVYQKGDVLGVSQSQVAALNQSWYPTQSNTQDGHFYTTPEQTIALPTANWNLNPTLSNAITVNLSPSLLNPNLLLSNLSLLSPTVNLNPSLGPFPNSPTTPVLTLAPSILDSMNALILSLTPIGAFYESGTLVYDETASIADKTARLFNSGTAVSIATFDGLDTNSNGTIDSGDSAYGNLTVWQDMNENGVVDSGESKTLSQAGLTTIAITDKQFLVSGNAVSVTATDVDTLRSSLSVSAPSAPTAPTDAPPDIPPNWGPGTSVGLFAYSGQYYIVGTNSGETIDDDYDATYQDVPNIIGFGGADTLVADDYSDTTNNTFWGGDGNDQFAGGAGNDRRKHNQAAITRQRNFCIPEALNSNHLDPHHVIPSLRSFAGSRRPGLRPTKLVGIRAHQRSHYQRALTSRTQ